MSITIEDVARKAVELADANPEHIYRQADGCLYVHRDESGLPTGYGCIFGQALIALGVSADVIPEGKSIAGTLAHLGIFGGTIPDFIHHGVIPGEPLLTAMTQAQTHQDLGSPWGKAIQPVKDALREMEEAA